MKLLPLLEAQSEFIPRDHARSTAGGIARQLLSTAKYEAGMEPRQARELAHKLANRFHSDVLAAIDEELNFMQMKSVDGRA
jgi:hypothetical protein